MLRYDFLMMDTEKSRMLSKVIMKYLKNSNRIHITTRRAPISRWKSGAESRAFSMAC